MVWSQSTNKLMNQQLKVQRRGVKVHVQVLAQSLRSSVDSGHHNARNRIGFVPICSRCQSTRRTTIGEVCDSVRLFWFRIL